MVKLWCLCGKPVLAGPRVGAVVADEVEVAVAQVVEACPMLEPGVSEAGFLGSRRGADPALVGRRLGHDVPGIGVTMWELPK